MRNYSYHSNDNIAVKNSSADTTTTDTQYKNASDALRDEHDRSVCSGPKNVETVNENNFSKLALTAFNSIDINKDGLLDKNELEHSINDNGKFPCASTDAARIMLKNFDVVKSFEGFDSSPDNDHIDGPHQPGISKDDLLKFDKIRHGDGFYGGYAKDSILNWALGTATVTSIPAAVLGSTASSALIGKGMVAGMIGMSGGIVVAAVAGAGLGAGINYYSYRHNHVPKLRTFLDDINASAELRSKI
ncbi:MAG: EF-hand domain-containing protein [Candidatus Obscuribacter sp.]|nr:EF-hand domain-containing protein [Candidatus Obscuribacter sp.]MBP6350070.1 EF-hand domain-containing protein [Candidatus Obscuribacter sp.]MBP6594203.1 EF-hand domain-containing protein [Candidatus Obscuribacter sp.]MBP7578305.1 EF-hand domain-containing protein [Candidatus Obscuribacter sp.]